MTEKIDKNFEWVELAENLPIIYLSNQLPHNLPPFSFLGKQKYNVFIIFKNW